MRVHTLRFGEIDVPEETVLHFPNGILGFPGLRRCCLLPHDAASSELAGDLRPAGALRPAGELSAPHCVASAEQCRPAGDHAPSAPRLRWLQSLDDPELLFLTLEPYLIFPDYEVELPDTDALALDLTTAEQAALLTLLTISEDGSAVTANLLAPIVINTQTRLARQVILETDRYLTKHLIAHQLTDEADAGIDAKTR